MKGRGKARENYTERRGREEGRIKRDEETVRGRQNERRRGTDNGRLKRGGGGGGGGKEGHGARCQLARERKAQRLHVVSSSQ